MTSFSTRLFLGFPKTDIFEKILRSADPQLIEMFIQQNSEYLEEISHHDVVYLGKWAGPMTDIKTLTLMELNIYSLLQRIAPDFPVTQTPLKLIPVRS